MKVSRRFFLSPLRIKTQTTQTPWQDNFLCLPPFSHSSVVNNFRIHFYVLGPNTFLGKKLTSLPSWIYSSIRLYALNMKSSSSTHRGLIITRSAGWPKKTCRIIAKHFLLPFRISLRHPRVFCLLTAIAIAPHPAQNFDGARPWSECHTHLGYFQSPVPYYLFFMFMWQKVPNPFRGARQPSAHSCYSTFFPGRKFKMFTYLTNIHYHATYSKLLCLNIRNL